ncbi:uncharacterized protein [Asterias amurensis]|uniref:uncharacterized protein n=1 Tax=Asterias amurensis TaxID=7602 RepID=UPI003AB69981
MAKGLSHNSTLERFGEEHLMCSICHELFKEPKTLSCFHTFCVNCLLTYQQSFHIKGKCPICRNITVPVRGDITSLTTDFKLTSMIETIKKEDQQAKKQETPTCKTHTGRKCWVYCETCNEFICLTCVTECHNGHAVEEISETVTDEKRQIVADHIPKIEKLLVKISQALDTVPRIWQTLQVAFATIRKDVEDKAIEEIARVNSDKQLILSELDETENERKLRLSQYEDFMKGEKRSLQNLMTCTKRALQVHNNCDFIISYSPLMRDFRILNECKTDQFETNLVSFQPTNTVGVCLGKLKQTPLSLENIEELEPQPQQSQSPCNKWKKIPSGVECGGRGVAVLLNGFVVADPRGQVIVTKSSSNTVWKNCKPNHPRDVSAVGSFVIAVDETKFVRVYNRNETSTPPRNFVTVHASEVKKTQVDLRCVAVKEDGDIVVGDAKSKVLSELSLIDGSIIRVVPVQTPPDFLAVNKYSQMLVSGEYSGTAEVLDSDGVRQFTITPYVNNAKVRCCTGVCWSKSGIYLAMHNKVKRSGHVHHYDDKGIFIECVIQGLILPQGISLTEDETRLIIADDHSVQIFCRI